MWTDKTQTFKPTKHIGYAYIKPTSIGYIGLLKNVILTVFVWKLNKILYYGVVSILVRTFAETHFCQFL